MVPSVTFGQCRRVDLGQVPTTSQWKASNDGLIAVEQSISEGRDRMRPTMLRDYGHNVRKCSVRAARSTRDQLVPTDALELSVRTRQEFGGFSG